MITGFPRSSGRRCSSAATKKASMSRWAMTRRSAMAPMLGARGAGSVQQPPNGDGDQHRLLHNPPPREPEDVVTHQRQLGVTSAVGLECSAVAVVLEAVGLDDEALAAPE